MILPLTFKKIHIFSYEGKFLGEEELTLSNLQGYIGMMARCYMPDGSYSDGFITFTPDNEPKDYGSSFFLWTWANLDEETHQLLGDGDEKYEQNYKKIEHYRDVEKIDVILFSNPRWGGRLYNHFFIDTTPSLSFDEVKHIFKTVWNFGYEEYWYQTVWKILEKNGLTRYKNELERYDVLLKAVAVSIIYEDFCNVYCDESPSYYYLDEFDVSPFVLGQLYGAKFPGEIVDTENDGEIIFIMAETYRSQIVRFIKKEMSYMEIFAHLACSVQSVTITTEFKNEDGEIYEDEEELIIESLDQYKKATEIFLEKLFVSLFPETEYLASWIEDGMLLTSSYN